MNEYSGGEKAAAAGYDIVDGTNREDKAAQAKTAQAASRAALAATREGSVYALRLSGRSFPQIAAALGYRDPSAAHKAWKRALRHTPTPVIEEYRRLHLEQTNEIIAALWEHRDRPVAIKGLLAALDHQARILGLYSARKIELGKSKETPQVLKDLKQYEYTLDCIIADRTATLATQSARLSNESSANSAYAQP